jgi:hypothetical protein
MQREASGSRRTGLLAAMMLCAVAAAMVVASAAGGRVAVTPSSVKITSGGPQGASGVVQSSSVCKRNRKVELFRGRQSVGTAKTEDDGTWEVHASLRAGTYVATVARRSFTTRHHGVTHHHVCGGDTSPKTRL